MNTPEARIAHAICEYLARGRAAARKREPLKVLEWIPEESASDEAEIGAELRPIIQRELILARIGTAQMFGTFQHVKDLREELDKVNAEIQKRKPS